MNQTNEGKARTAGEAGWHASRYNLFARVPDSDNVAIANLFKGTCAEYNLIEVYLLSKIEQLSEHHPVIEKFEERGLICKFDERAALETFARASCARARRIDLTPVPIGCIRLLGAVASLGAIAGRPIIVYVCTRPFVSMEQEPDVCGSLSSYLAHYQSGK